MADIYRRIEEEIPRLRRYARALTRDVTAADDLVQDCLTRALEQRSISGRKERICGRGCSRSCTTNTSTTSAVRCARAPRSDSARASRC